MFSVWRRSTLYIEAAQVFAEDEKNAKLCFYSWCNSTQAGLLLSWWLWRKPLRHLCQGHQGEMMIDRSWKWLRNNFFLPQSPSRVGMKFRRKWINFWVQCSINMVLVGNWEVLENCILCIKATGKRKIWILSNTFCIQSESSKVNLALFEFWRRPRVIPGVKLDGVDDLRYGHC